MVVVVGFWSLSTINLAHVLYMTKFKRDGRKKQKTNRANNKKEPYNPIVFIYDGAYKLLV